MVKFFILFFVFSVGFPFSGKAAPLRIFLKFDPPEKEVYVGQETRFNITLYDRIGLNDVVLVPPELPNADIFLSQNKPFLFFNKDDGITYDANELHFSLVPKSAGNMRFPPFCLSAAAPTMISARDLPENISLLDTGELIICTAPFEIKVDPLPEYAVPLFAAEEVSLYDGVVPKKNEIEAGTSVKRSLLLSATGTLPAFLPDFNLPPVKNAKTYNGKTERNQPASPSNLKAALRRTVIIVPQEEGSLVLPEVKVPWMNVRTGRIQISVIPSRVLTVKPVVLSEEKKVSFETGNEKKGNIFLLNGKGWCLIPFVSALLAFLFFVLIKKIKRRMYRNNLIKAVETACLSGKAEEMEKAVLLWAKGFFPNDRFVSLSDVRSLFSAENEEFVRRLEDLEQYLYGTGRFARHLPETVENLGGKIYDAFKTVSPVKRTRKKEKKNCLPQLYPDDFTSS